MTSAPRMKPFIVPLTLALIFILSLWANLENNGFPLGYHIDEPGKVKAIIGGVYKFNHPAFMIHIVRFANLFTNYAGNQDIVELGRAVSALFGTGIVFATFYLIRVAVGLVPAVLTALAVAVSPILVVHAHYLKEDVYFTFFALLALASLLRVLQSSRRARIIELGIVSGLAASSKYVGATLLLFYFLVPLVYPVGNIRVYFTKIFWVIFISFTLYLAVNYPIFLDVDNFLRNTKFELKHVAQGHNIANYPLQLLFTFHFVHGIVPGLTPVLAFAGLAGMVLSRVKAFSLTDSEKVLLFFAVLYYLLIEVSPNKPFPDFMRYTLPLVPVVLYFAVRAIFGAAKLIAARSQAAAAALFAVCLAWPAYASFMYVRYMEDDTRAKLQGRVGQLREPGRILFEYYAKFEPPNVSRVAAIPRDDLAALRVPYVVVSSFSYERYALGKTLWWQDDIVHLRARRYDALFTCPYVEIRPAFRSLAFSNPTIRIVYIWQCPRDFDYP